jgi:hypothetical protein
MNTGGTKSFTDREVTIMGLLAAGQAPPQIARQLGVSEATVAVHLAMIRYKARVDPPTHLSVSPAPSPEPGPGHPASSFAHWLRAVV